MVKNILGLHVSGSQSGAAILQDGKLIAAVSEERFNRQKRSRAFPHQAIKYCLESIGLSDLRDVDHVVMPWNPAIHMKNMNMSGFTQWRRYEPEWLYILPNNMMPYLEGENIQYMQQGMAERGGLFYYLSHHMAHMGWAYASSFEECAIAVIDEHAESDAISYGTLKGNKVDVLKSVPFPHSMGIYYATFTEYLGFQANGEEWKVMGAAAFGSPERFQDIIRGLVRYEEGNVVIDQYCFTFSNMRVGGYFGEELIKYLGVPPRKPNEPLEQIHYDFAAAVQYIYEEILFSSLDWLAEETGMSNLVLAGGCAMNSLANGKIIGNTNFKKLFVGPAAGDNGCAISAALWLHAQEKQDVPDPFRASVSAYTGPSWNDDEIEKTLQRYKLHYKKSSNIVSDTVECLINGKIVGWFHGALEFGERALGARSILADPRDETMKDKINLSVKYREAFRPFAPSILWEKVSQYFDIPDGASADYMEQVYSIKEDKRSIVPAVVHNDGTGRLQTVKKETNLKYWQLISEFEKKTGVPLVLNTSFNVAGEPMVCSPDDAIRTFFTSGLDILAIGTFIVQKDN
ncbi:conserved hypothetical protein [Candidatus Terasakiella magnetica]|uniref:Carbamoyltransferase n=1 Tax=Candidatus Terasakiella magnetica TaxID=1867952 RepID=A0A1C3RG14_9PROT|nr:carbamoyltransferase C-terminal domain-containing protein [Candidatus Terasakiella magnetica]SCA56243.1 conserved hypothetical protein [Candidatus Terasakiella magnetica]